MDKLAFTLDDGSTRELYVLGETKLDGISFLLVSESEDEDDEVMIFRASADTEDEEEAVYDLVTEEDELKRAIAALEEALDDISIEV